MKKNLFILAFATTMFALSQKQNVFAQTKDYKVVFDLTSGDTTDHQSVLRWLNGISKGNPDAKLEVVFYGQSLSMVTAGKSTVSEQVKELAKNKNIAFRVCAVALKAHHLTTSDLLPGVETVPDGIGEIVQKQKQGWSYIKAGR